MIVGPGIWMTLLSIAIGSAGAGSAPERWVDDEQVLAARRVRLSAGVGAVRVATQTLTNQTRAFTGTGLSFAEAVGLGHDLEVGVRFGFTTDAAGRGLRADEVGRGFETETFGTGLSAAANPEMRLRWRALRWPSLEAGLENRVVLPVVLDPSLTEWVAAWTSVHFGHVGRLDVAVEGILGWSTFAAANVLQPGFGLPVAFFANVTPAAFVGIMASARYFGPTDYTHGHARLITGLGFGYRLPPCDVTLTAFLLDTLTEFKDRAGLGIGLSCTM